MHKIMKIVYFGSDVFLSCFEYLAENTEILALYTYHNDEDYFNEYSIIDEARKLGIPVFYDEITPEKTRQYFEEDGCDFFFIAEYDKRIAVPEDLDSFKGINTHSSLLPEGRSYYPIECAMERDLPVTGVTMHKITNRLDAGDIIGSCRVKITPDTDSIDIYLMNAANAREMLSRIMEDFDGAWINAKPQGQIREYWKRPADSLLTITHDMTVTEACGIFRKYNSMTELVIEDKIYFVTGIMPGRAPLFRSEVWLGTNKCLYALKDGHIRTAVAEKNQKNRK